MVQNDYIMNNMNYNIFFLDTKSLLDSFNTDINIILYSTETIKIKYISFFKYILYKIQLIRNNTYQSYESNYVYTCNTPGYNGICNFVDIQYIYSFCNNYVNNINTIDINNRKELKKYVKESLNDFKEKINEIINKRAISFDNKFLNDCLYQNNFFFDGCLENYSTKNIICLSDEERDTIDEEESIKLNNAWKNYK